MFDFQISLASKHVETVAPLKIFEMLTPTDRSVDPLIFESVPLNRIDLP